MQIGIFAKTFARPTLDATLDAVAAHGLHAVQFNLSCAGLPTLPDDIDEATCAAIGRAHAMRGISMAALSGTFNMIHPDETQRAVGLRRLEVLVAAAPRLGARLITLCTGTRDPADMWRRHPDNDSPEAWRDLLQSLETALRSAQRHDVVLGIEPEVSNVVDSATKARRLLDELNSPHLKIVMDGANLFHSGELARMDEVLDKAFALLGGDIVLTHAKDLRADGAAGNIAAGEGVLDYHRYLSLLRACGYGGPLVLHSLHEEQVPQAVRFLSTLLEHQEIHP
jgi:sugar phosphate isomerase/epimerase